MYDKFRQLLDNRGITPYKLAKDTGIPQSTLSDWKAGRSTPKLDKLLKISTYLNITIEELINTEKYFV